MAAIKEGLRDVGYSEGQNVAFEYRWAEGRYERLPGQAADLVRQGVAVIVLVGGGPTACATQAVCHTTGFAVASITVPSITSTDSSIGVSTGGRS
jgi:putative ABC transport system substrate-binding protein